MTTFHRWLRFNLVGAIGMLFQLSMVTLLNYVFPKYPILTTGTALELTLLHNFIWHTRFTWKEQAPMIHPLQRLLRFHISNGAISYTGNLILTYAIVRSTRIPLALCNAIAILVCSCFNFLTAQHWAFATPRGRNRGGAKAFLVITMLTALTSSAQMQTTSARQQLPNAPSPSVWKPSPNDSYVENAGILCAAGASTSSIASRPTFGCGAGITIAPLPVFFEIGILGPQAHRSYVSGYLSVDGQIPLASPKLRAYPSAIIGYSRLFETGHAFDYGVSLALPRPWKPKEPSSSMRIELRDYWTFASPAQHNVVVRLGWMSEIVD